MDLSTPLRQISAAGAQIIGRLSEEAEREAPTTGAGEDAPKGPSTSELDNILDKERASVKSVGRPDRSNVRFSREPSRDETNSGDKRRFAFPSDDESVEYSVSGSASTPERTSRYDDVDRRSPKKRPKDRGLSDVLGHDFKAQVHLPKIT